MSGTSTRASAPASAPALDPGNRLWTLIATAACLLPLLLQLPLTIAASIAGFGVLATAIAWRWRLPAWLRLPLMLLLLFIVLSGMHFSFGRDTGCAILAAMLAIKPSETLTVRDARSLLGFALFAPFATFLLDQGPLSLLLGLAAATLVLVVLQRLAEQTWILPDDSTGTASATRASDVSVMRRFANIGRMIAFGLPLALAVFWLFPRLATPLWGVPERALARPGLSDEMSPGQWLELMTDDTPALRARFFGPEPTTSQMYWRGPVLWHFDGRSWTRPRWLAGLPAAEVRHAETIWEYEMALEPTGRRDLVALELPLAAPDDARLSLAYGLSVKQPLNSLTRWRMRSSPAIVFAAKLPGTLRQAALQLPEGFNPRTHALARQWRDEAGDDDAAIVKRALDWISRDFGYTLATPLPGRHAVDEFLFDQQAGYCEHFSSAFVVLMRAAGIPARVVTGYVGGYRNPIGNYWLVRRSDAHAWAEVWLPERGWVRVDPTAAVAPERIYDTLADRMPGSSGLFDTIGSLTPMFNVSDWMRRGWNDFVLGFDAARQRRLLRPLGIDDIRPSALTVLLAGALVLGLLLTAWLSTRNERERDPVLRAWRRLQRRYARLGLGREPHEPALAWGRRVAQARPDLAHSLDSLSLRLVDWRYAAHDHDPQVARVLVHDLRAYRPRRH